MKRIKFCLLGITQLLMLTGCGGGESGSNSNSNYFVSVDTSELNFTVTRSQQKHCSVDSQTVSISFKGDGLILGYPPGVSANEWLYRPILSNVTSNSAKLTVEPNFSCSDQPRLSTTTLRVISGKQDGSEVVSKDIRVSFEVVDNLSLNTNNDLQIGISADGSSQTDAVELEVDTWNQDWKIISDVNWLVFNPSQASGDNSRDNQIVQVSVDPDKFPSQDSIANFTLQKPDGTLQSVGNIKINVEQVRAWFSKPNLAFSLFDGYTVNSKTIDLYSNADLDFSNVIVNTDASWLTIELDNKQVKLSVKRGRLADGLYRTSVSFVKDGEQLAENLHVGLYIHDGVEPKLIETSFEQFSHNHVAIIDPIAPYVFSISSPSVKIFNIYTGQLIEELSLPLKEELFYNHFLWEFPHYISDDGKTLFVSNSEVDSQASGGEQHIYHRYDLINRKWLTDVAAIENRKPFALQGQRYRPVTFQAVDGSATLSIDQEECGFIELFVKPDFISRIIDEGDHNEEENIELKFGFGTLKTSVYRKTGVVKCESLHTITSAQVDTEFDYTRMSLSPSGRYIALKDRLFNYSSQTGFSNGIDLVLPEVITNNDNVSLIWFESILVDEQGRSFALRDVHTGTAGEPDYITQYDKQGHEFRTIATSVDGINFSADGRMLLVNTETWGGSSAKLKAISKDKL